MRAKEETIRRQGVEEDQQDKGQEEEEQIQNDGGCRTRSGRRRPQLAAAAACHQEASQRFPHLCSVLPTGIQGPDGAGLRQQGGQHGTGARLALPVQIGTTAFL